MEGTIYQLKRLVNYLKIQNEIDRNYTNNEIKKILELIEQLEQKEKTNNGNEN